jgi:hypothetical protein
MLAHYTHGFKTDKLEAQAGVEKTRSGNPSNREWNGSWKTPKREGMAVARGLEPLTSIV